MVINKKQYDSILLRYGEVGLKSQRKRPYFERLYINAIKEALERKNISYDRLENAGGRFILETKTVEEGIFVLKNVPGIQSMSPAKKFTFNDKKELLEIIKNYCVDIIRNKIFRVTVRRTGNHDFSSMDFAKELGEILLPFSKGVSLKNPETNIQIEIREKKAYVFFDSISGLDGMPPASSGKALCLFSGGIDSPVAAYQMLKRGVAVDYLHIDLSGNKTSFVEISKLYNHLTNEFSFNYTPKFYLVNGQKLIDTIIKKVPQSFRQLALKIAFYKLGEYFVNEKNYSGLITGESIAQKSSQTLSSLSFINSFNNCLVLRPLVVMDKLEITRIAEKIGTFGTSQYVKEFCDLSEGKAVTATPLKKDVKQIFEMDSLIKQVIEETITTKGLLNIEKKESEIKIIEKNAKIIDLRTKTKSKNEPLCCGENIPYAQMIDKINELDKEAKYVFVCEQGVQSDSIKYACEQRNIKAQSFSMKEFIENMKKNSC